MNDCMRAYFFKTKVEKDVASLNVTSVKDERVPTDVKYCEMS